ncbi:RnfABCDGE type electron transport complex subunit D [Photobacterium sp. MCCC 1A19761]|uniref:RnfABCDGE type electron transport complex subunit D n=1 Tax=Photobacterium sp. MCCC 1A19761 TaxID=3115000 RepID=UPI00307DC060
MNLRPRSVRGIMLAVSVALLPGTFLFAVQYGPVVWLQAGWCLCFALLLEVLFLWLRKKSIKAGLADCSWLVCGLLMARALPLMTPAWMIFLATFTALGVVKHSCGGLGANRLNPVMAGLAMITICFYQQLYPAPSSQLPWTLELTVPQVLGHQWLLEAPLTFDGVTGVTPLSKDLLNDIAPYYSWIGYLAGGLLLALLKVIRLEIPLMMMIASALLCVALGHTLDEAMYNLTLGGFLFAAFFIATDPVTSPDTRAGRILYGLIIGIITELVREFGLYADGICFAVLTGNLLIPQLDLVSRRIYCTSRQLRFPS